MIKFGVLTAITVAIFLWCYYSKLRDEAENPKTLKNQDKKAFYIILLLCFAFIVRVIFAITYYGLEVDVNCFTAWSNMVYDNGFRNFYTSEAFTDYPPGYIYILYLIGFVRDKMGLQGAAGLSLLLIKLPAILCDLVLGFLIYRISIKRFSEWASLLLASLFLLNPVTILDSSTWGQVDSVFTLFVVSTIYLLANKKRIPAYFTFAVGILMKPQTLIFTPILIFAIIEQVLLNGFSWKRFLKDMAFGLMAIGSIFLFSLPFGIGNVIKQYVETLGSYPFASVNAYNFWALLGKNWRTQEETFLSLSYDAWGTIFIVLIVAITAILFFKAKKNESKYYFTGACIVIGMFVMSVRMHERYVYPAVPLLLLAFITKPRMEKFLLYTALTATGFLNMVHVLFYYDHENYDWHNPVIFAIAFLTVMTFGFLCYVAFQHYWKEQPTEEEWVRENKKKRKKMQGRANRQLEGKFAFHISEPAQKLVRFDFIAITAITLVYAFIAFYNLGDRVAPQTKWETFVRGDQIELDFGETKNIKEMAYFLGNYHGRKYTLEVSDNREYGWETVLKENYLDEMDEKDREGEPYMKMNSVFCWDRLTIQKQARFLRITSKDDKMAIFELAFIGEDGQMLTPDNASDYAALFDEQDLVPDRRSFRNGTYFDEIYHARTAYEYIHGLYSYENTHPPLGKGIIALGILMFGMNPFGWRFMGTLFGVFMIPFIYLFAKRLLKTSWLAATVTTLFAFDFMHFAQTRIATIDVYVTFFVILMYFFMYCYTKLSFYDSDFKKTLIPLGLSGISMGLGIASKWPGIYAGGGLAVIFFLTLYQRFREYQYAKERPGKKTGGVDHDSVVARFPRYTVMTLLFCIVFFIVVPAVIYALSYLPFSDGSDKGWIAQMVGNQQTMYGYHSKLEATHGYSSWWYEWPIMARPILFYAETVRDTLKEGISSFGNPLVWWAGIPAFCHMVYLAIRKKDRNAIFLIIAYFAQYAPWFLVTRITFIYHYFPSVPFITLMLGYSMFHLYRWKPKLKYAIFAYAGLACILFILFYPVLSGTPIDERYADLFLKWFRSWVLVI